MVANCVLISDYKTDDLPPQMTILKTIIPYVSCSTTELSKLLTSHDHVSLLI